MHPYLLFLTIIYYKVKLLDIKVSKGINQLRTKKMLHSSAFLERRHSGLYIYSSLFYVHRMYQILWVSVTCLEMVKITQFYHETRNST